MKKMFLFLTICCFCLMSFAYNVNAFEIGKKYHITGCDNGYLVVPLVKMWKYPGGLATPGQEIVGKLAGDGREDQGLKCQGAIVEIIEVQGQFIKVKSIINGNIGWVTELFIGKKVK